MRTGEMKELFDKNTQRGQRPPLVPKDTLEQFKDAMEASRQALLGNDGGGGRKCIRKDCVFRDVTIALPLEAPLLVAGDGDGQGKGGKKSMIHPSIALDPSYDCVVYGMGISGNSRFEQHMSRYCPQGVHAFDCTINSTKPSVFGMNFTFHPTCVGESYDLSSGSIYANKTTDALHFETLPNIMKELRHTHLDILKLDVEGSEWRLLEDLPVKPRQLFFELHSQGAKRRYVPQHLIEKKDKAATNAMFLKLFDMGYRVISKDINGGDRACAEFSLVLVGE